MIDTLSDFPTFEEIKDVEEAINIIDRCPLSSLQEIAAEVIASCVSNLQPQVK